MFRRWSLKLTDFMEKEADFRPCNCLIMFPLHLSNEVSGCRWPAPCFCRLNPHTMGEEIGLPLNILVLVKGSLMCLVCEWEINIQLADFWPVNVSRPPILIVVDRFTKYANFLLIFHSQRHGRVVPPKDCPFPFFFYHCTFR